MCNKAQTKTEITNMLYVFKKNVQSLNWLIHINPDLRLSCSKPHRRATTGCDNRLAWLLSRLPSGQASFFWGGRERVSVIYKSFAYSGKISGE